ELLRQDTKTLGSAAQNRFDRRIRWRQHLGESLMFRTLDRSYLADECVDVGAIRLVGGDASRGCVRVEKKPLLLQITHRVPDGSRRNAEPETPRQHSRSGGLGGLNVRLDDRFQHALFALRKRLDTAHKFKCRNDFGLESSDWRS